VSTLGIGTYLGGADEATDRGYAESVALALRSGINFIDTAINYRNQRSERSIGVALREMIASGETHRDEVVVCTKAGFLVPGAVPREALHAADVAGGIHSMAPDFLADQIDRSRENLGLETLDVFYLHNPETQLGFVPRAEFDQRIRLAFARLEQLASHGAIRFYGTATWDGYRRTPDAPDVLSLGRMLKLAREAGGEGHRFRFIQLPFNLAMVEALVQKKETLDREPASVLELAAANGITVVASATLLQAKLAQGLPEAIAERLPGAATDAQRAIQFTRSTPGITVALAGMSREAHVAENIGVAGFAPASPAEYRRLYED
jgi:aryl-alcohol dehydrogenase-like predicted oxidoreductase